MSNVEFRLLKLHRKYNLVQYVLFKKLITNFYKFYKGFVNLVLLLNTFHLYQIKT